MGSADDRDADLPTYQDAQDEIEQLAGCIRFELWFWLIGFAVVGVLAFHFLR